MRRLPHLLAFIALAGCAEPAPEPEPESPTPEGVFGQAPAAVGGIPSVVRLRPLDDLQTPSGASGTIDQLGLQFSPTRLIVPVGATVTFTNSESLAHNVQLTRVGDSEPFFDEDAEPSAALEATLNEVGGVDVTCAFHPGMTAFIFVTDTYEQYTTVADTDGRFAITGVPANTWELHVWSVDETLRSVMEIEVGEGPTEVRFPSGGG